MTTKIITRSILRDLERELASVIVRVTGRRPRGSVFELPRYADVWAQLTIEEFEYPRQTPLANLEFVGPLRPLDFGALPSWWDRNDDRPVVHLRYEPGTPLSNLVVPAIIGLENANVLLVLTGPESADIEKALGSGLPEHVRVAHAVPYSLLLASAGAAIKAGDYVRTQYALRFGVPVVAAGSSAEHRETNARIAWSGAGIDLGTSTPTPAAIRSAITTALEDDSIRASARRLAAKISKTDAELRLCELIEELGRDA